MKTPPAAPAPVKSAAALPAPAGPPAIVQIAAVSHQEDADALVAALQKQGYQASVHSEAKDKLLHVQIGPFSNRADAAAMKQQLLSHGYNAIVK